jgi:chromosome segregation ATPase
MGFYGAWVLLLAFWWGVLLKRHELIGYISLDRRPTDGLGIAPEGQARGGFSAMGLWYGAQMARSIARPLTAPLRAPVRRLRRGRLERKIGQAQQTVDAAQMRAEFWREQLDANAEAYDVEVARDTFELESRRVSSGMAELERAEERRASLLDRQSRLERARAQLVANRRELVDEKLPELFARKEDLESEREENQDAIGRIDEQLLDTTLPRASREDLMRSREAEVTRGDLLQGRLAHVNRKIEHAERRKVALDNKIDSVSGRALTATEELDEHEANTSALRWEVENSARLRNVAGDRVERADVEHAERMIFGITTRERDRRRQQSPDMPGAVPELSEANARLAKNKRKLRKLDGRRNVW